VVPLWVRHTRYWLDAQTPTFLIRYEDCLREPENQFRSLLSWLQRPVTEETLRTAIEQTSFDALKRKQSAESDMGGKFFRRGAAAKGIERFSPAQREWVSSCASRELADCGYEPYLKREVS
jgi:hypothetical protein